ncbi:MAG: Glycerophosphoryl diester phosphodiesterase [Actinomycetia bacterium]|nr:Glycerophosphoryl diester phosphodiesterase [Actinomycetes bacterium]
MVSRGFITVVLAVVLVSCASGSSNRATTSTSTTTRAPVTTTTAAPALSARVVKEVVVDPVYRQGLARRDGGWAFSFNDGLFLTDDALHQTKKLVPAIPAEWKARGFDHIGDIDVADGVLYAPLEQPNYKLGHQAMLMYDATTLAYRAGVEVPQHEASFVTVDPSGIAYSMDHFGGAALLRYDVANGWRPLAPLEMSRSIARVQGADVYHGAVWLSTDDAHEGVYRVDLRRGRQGQVQSLGSIGHVDGEGEGIDATPTANADLRVLSIDAKAVPVRIVELRVTPAGH